MKTNFTIPDLVEKVKRGVKTKRGYRPTSTSEPFDEVALAKALDIVSTCEVHQIETVMLVELQPLREAAQLLQATYDRAIGTLQGCLTYRYERYQLTGYNKKLDRFEARMAHTYKQTKQFNDDDCLSIAREMVPSSAEDIVEVNTPDGRRLVYVSERCQKRIDKNPAAQVALDWFMRATPEDEVRRVNKVRVEATFIP